MIRAFAYLKRGSCLLALAAPMALGACGGGGGGVQFEGKMFEMVGLGDEQKRQEENVPNRAPLVLPPEKQANLPEPGRREVAATPQDWPADPDTARKAEKKEEKKQQQAYQDKGDWSEDAGIDEFEKLMDPMERHSGLLGDTALGGNLRGGESEDTAQ